MFWGRLKSPSRRRSGQLPPLCAGRALLTLAETHSIPVARGRCGQGPRLLGDLGWAKDWGSHSLALAKVCSP